MLPDSQCTTDCSIILVWCCPLWILNTISNIFIIHITRRRLSILLFGIFRSCFRMSPAHWDKEHDTNLLKQSEIYWKSYELNYINTEGEFCATVLTPLECYVLEDGTAERNIMLAIHKFKKRFDNTAYLDVYTDAEILHYKIMGGELEVIGSHSHIFGRVPVTICPANSERKIYDMMDQVNFNSMKTGQAIPHP